MTVLRAAASSVMSGGCGAFCATSAGPARMAARNVAEITQPMSTPRTFVRLAPNDPVLGQAPFRVARMPRDESPRHETRRDRTGDQEPEHRRQSDGHDEHAAEHEDQ